MMRPIVEGLRELADFLDQHPEVPPPTVTIDAFVHSRDQLAAIARIGGWSKGGGNHYFWLARHFPGEIKLEVNVAREEVCERVVLGTRLVPAVPAHEEEVVEWRCESLLAPEDEEKGGSEPAVNEEILT